MKIANDISGINNARMLQTSQNAQKKSMEKLASGSRINRSADDAAGGVPSCRPATFQGLPAESCGSYSPSYAA